jgi:ubiquinone/menaquinone biosynthesis C-methylase UbiE
MRLRADRRRLLLGFRGLALLRGWPTGAPEIADAHIAEMRKLLAEDAERDEIVIDDEGVSAAYELWAATYDVEPNALIGTEEPLVIEILSGLPVGRAVDAACGTGRLAAALAELGHDVVAIDRSDAMLAKARSKDLSARFLRGDLHALPLADATADLAVCGLALSHVEDLRQPIAELSRIVRPGGYVIVSEFHPFAVATGGQAVPARSDGTRLLARNLQHWPSEYVAAFQETELEILRLAEPLVDESFVASIQPPGIWGALADALIGLPVAMIWVLRRR